MHMSGYPSASKILGCLIFINNVDFWLRFCDNYHTTLKYLDSEHK
jgi:hypothetical protein